MVSGVECGGYERPPRTPPRKPPSDNPPAACPQGPPARSGAPDRAPRARPGPTPRPPHRPPRQRPAQGRTERASPLFCSVSARCRALERPVVRRLARRVGGSARPGWTGVGDGLARRPARRVGGSPAALASTPKRYEPATLLACYSNSVKFQTK